MRMEIAVIALGGTIATTSRGTGGVVPRLTVADLVAAASPARSATSSRAGR
jgi:L-asparaginase/Glu-tRNA(Gln) amidotransferase subunit D